MSAGFNLYDVFGAAARAAGETPCIVQDGATALGYDSLDRASAAWANALARLGIGPGDRIIVQAEKSVEVVVLYLAGLRAGFVHVPLNPAYTPPEVGYFVADSEPALIVCDEGREEALAAVSGGVKIVSLEGLALLASPQSRTFETVGRGPDDLAAILYTSGTTGRSKGAMLSHENLASNAIVLKQAWRWRDGDVLIHALPIYHVHGLFVALHGALLNGSTMIWHRAFSAEAIIADLPRATILMGVPTFYVRLAANPGLTSEAAAGMRLFVSGSAPLLESTFAEFEAKTGHRILERYGMTEAGMICSNPYDGDRIPGTVGFALPGAEARVADSSGRELPRGEPGTLEIKGPNLFRGYWRQADKTKQAIRPDGFFITGDIATMGEDGRVAIVGRGSDMIIAGGLNLYPREIEVVIDSVPGVAESAVIGVPHPDLGEAAVAVVVRADPTLDADAIIEQVSRQLARFKIPRRIVFADALPRNAMGKVQKAALRKAHADIFSA
jgi:malonyl-CoA/methylmalonyl-CoA synthetase